MAQDFHAALTGALAGTALFDPRGPKDTVIDVNGKVRRAVKGRKGDRVLVLNRIAQSIVQARRSKHPTHVFAFRARHVRTMSNSA